MRSPVVDDDLHARDGKLHLRPLGQALPETLFTGSDVLGGNRPAPDLVVENEVIFAFRDGLHVTRHTAVLAGAAGLLLVGVIEFRPLRDRLTVGHAGLSRFHIGSVFPFHPLHIDFQMQFAHPLDDRLVGLIIHMGAEGRILLREAVEGLGHVDLGFVVLRKYRQRDHRFRNEHGGHGQVEARGNKGIAGGALDSEKGPDITGGCGLDVFHLIGVHANDASDLRFLPVRVLTITAPLASVPW